MQFQVLAASVQELQEAYQESLLKVMEAQQQGKLVALAYLEAESDFWKREFMERISVLSERVGSGATDSGTDKGK